MPIQDNESQESEQKFNQRPITTTSLAVCTAKEYYTRLLAWKNHSKP